MEVIRILATCIFVVCTQVQALTMDKSRAIPSSRKYVAQGYAINRVPTDVNYDNKECSIVESSVSLALEEHAANDTSFNKDRAMQKFSSCQSTICGSREILKMLRLRSALMQTLNSVVITFGKTFNPGYKVFRMLVHPKFTKIISSLADDEFPLVQQPVFGKQVNVVFEIIRDVCGHQKQTIKAEMTPEFVAEMFLFTLIPAYVKDAFNDGVYEQIVGNARSFNLLRFWWNMAATKRSADHPCIDPELEKYDTHVTIEILQRHAFSLTGVKCDTNHEDHEYAYESYAYASYAYAPPPSDIGPDDNGPPSDNGPGSNGPPSGWPSNTFSP